MYVCMYVCMYQDTPSKVRLGSVRFKVRLGSVQDSLASNRTKVGLHA